ncbi:MAG: hypothetical protein JOY96_08860 [Verrucomicrobia bacterium]|nr:hypothetical protein [Verrucomicrobiota bacterium]
MNWVIGWLVWLLTFPGRIIRVVSYRMLCDINKVEVFEVDYFRGTIALGEIPSLGTALFIATAPLCVNTLLCAVLTFPAALPMAIGAENMPPSLLFLFWLGISIGMNAFPDRKYSLYLIERGSISEKRKVLNRFARGLCLLFGLANFLKRFWFDFIYALLVSISSSSLIVSLNTR